MIATNIDGREETGSMRIPVLSILSQRDLTVLVIVHELNQVLRQNTFSHDEDCS